MKKIIAFIILIGLTLMLILLPKDNYTNNGEKIIGSYDIRDGEYSNLYKTKFTEDNQNKLEIISTYIENILPRENFDMLDSLIIMSDGKGNTLAYVYQTKDKWNLCIDYLDALDEENVLDENFVATLSHELMHLISLNEDQFDNNQSPSTYETTEGKLSYASYLNQFYNSFWLDEAENHSMYLLDGDAGRIRYFDEHIDMFINDYAATNPEEDIAESFAAFVLSDKPRGNKIYEKKILFFYNYPEFVDIRNDIRKNSGV